MTKIRIFLFASLALALVLGVCGPQAFAAEIPFHAHTMTLRAPVSVGPDVAPKIVQGITGMGPNPVIGASSSESWPCFGGTAGATCAGDDTDGVVIGEPIQVWSAATCTYPNLCGQIYWTFQASTAAGVLKVSVVVKQGTKTVYDLPLTNIGSIPAGGALEIISGSFGFGPGSGQCPAAVTCVAPVAGPAIVTVSSKVGSAPIIKGTLHLTLTP